MIQHLRHALVKQLSEAFQPLGFKYTNYSGFVRRLDGVSHHYYLNFVPRPTGYLVSSSMAIRIYRVEDIFHRTSGFEKKAQKLTTTIGAGLSNYLGDYKKCTFILTKTDEVESVARELFLLFETVAQPYYESSSSVEVIDTLLNEEPLLHTPHIGLPIFRASKGLIVAQLTGRENYPELVDLYRGVVKKAAGNFYLPQFDALVKDLASMCEVSIPQRNSLHR